jgi:hypothetical protein
MSGRHAAGSALKQDVESLADNADAGPQDEGGDEQRENRVDPVLSGEQDACATGDDSSGGERVTGHVQKGRAQVHVASHAPEQGGDHAIHQHTGGGHDHHQPGLHGHWRVEAMDGLNADPERYDDEAGRIDEGGHHPGALVAECLGVAGGARLKVDGGKAEQQREKIGGIVPGLGEKRERVGAQAGHESDRDISKRGH